jgi:hypothetical protein
VKATYVVFVSDADVEWSSDYGVKEGNDLSSTRVLFSQCIKKRSEAALKPSRQNRLNDPRESGSMITLVMVTW